MFFQLLPQMAQVFYGMILAISFWITSLKGIHYISRKKVRYFNVIDFRIKA
jgi:hypothetical protein